MNPVYSPLLLSADEATPYYGMKSMLAFWIGGAGAEEPPGEGQPRQKREGGIPGTVFGPSLHRGGIW